MLRPHGAVAGEQLSAIPGSARGSLGSVALLIPSWKPTHTLPALVADLGQRGFGPIVIVDDGSPDACHPVFADVMLIPGVKVLRHAVNLGKGRALKTGFNYLLNTCPACAGVVTADADGQHLPDDVERVAHKLLESGGRPVLGARAFDQAVPFRSRLGNTLTRRIFGFLTGVTLRDTQTGLRGLPLALLPPLLALEGERYEYEMTMLAHLCRIGESPLELPIATVYLENNRGSHFNPVWDSMRIYFVLLRFYASSLLAAGIDLAGFSLCFALTHHLLPSVIVGRLSSVINYAVNRRFVFCGADSVPQSLWRYYALATLVGVVSYGLILLLTAYAHWHVLGAKITVDVVLSLASFSAQKTFVFRRGEPL